jgi:prepilin-type N-terminal cleavage/methylation domain-containing protein
MKQVVRITNNFQLSIFNFQASINLPIFNYLLLYYWLFNGNCKLKIKNSWRSQGGFTLIEMVMAIGLMGVLAAFSYPVFGNLFTRSDLDSARSTLVQAIRRAEVNAQSQDGDSIAGGTQYWGVDVQSGTITVFRTASDFTNRVSSDDVTYSYASTVTINPHTDILFNRVTGYPASVASFTLTIADGTNGSVSVNGKGMVSY